MSAIHKTDGRWASRQSSVCSPSACGFAHTLTEATASTTSNVEIRAGWQAAVRACNVGRVKFPIVALFTFLGIRMAHAQRSVPPGDEWWCTSLSAADTEDEISDCVRTKARCDRSRELWLTDGNEFEGREASDCRAQRNAAVFWWFDVMKGEDRFSAYASMRSCRGLRSFRLGQRDDVTRVSQCSIVGVTKPPRPNRKHVPRGKGWTCYAYTAPASGQAAGRCFRNHRQCTEQLDLEVRGQPAEPLPLSQAECRVQKRAFLFTAGGLAYEYPTSEVCDRIRLWQDSRGLNPSRCEPLP